jgi:hypothetical protein
MNEAKAMKRILYGLAIAGLLPILISIPAVAQSRPLPERLTPDQLQRFSRDLTRPSIDDFFERGQRQLEREIDILLQRRILLSEGILKIDPNLKLQQDFNNFERPNLPMDNDRAQ